MANKHHTRKGKKMSRKNIRSKKVKLTRKQINKKKTRKQKGGVQRPETIEKKKVLNELMPTFKTESIYRAFTGIDIEKIKNMTPEERIAVYTKWRAAEDKRREELRVLQKLKTIYDEIDASSSVKGPEVGKKRGVSSKQPRDEFNTPFKKQARRVIGLEVVPINLFEKEYDIHEPSIDYTEVKPLPEANLDKPVLDEPVLDEPVLDEFDDELGDQLVLDELGDQPYNE